MLKRPLQNMINILNGQPPALEWNQKNIYGCSLTLAGYGYPYFVTSVPKLPIDIKSPIKCDLWWNEVDTENGQLYMANHKNLEMGHRIADINCCSTNPILAAEIIEREIKKIRCLSSYYRCDLKDLVENNVSFFDSIKNVYK